MAKGRPRKYTTEEEKKAARRKWRQTYYAKYPDRRGIEREAWKNKNPDKQQLYIARSGLRWMLKNGHVEDVAKICKTYGLAVDL